MDTSASRWGALVAVGLLSALLQAVSAADPIDCARDHSSARRFGFTARAARYYRVPLVKWLEAREHRPAPCDGLATNHNAQPRHYQNEYQRTRGGGVTLGSGQRKHSDAVGQAGSQCHRIDGLRRQRDRAAAFIGGVARPDCPPAASIRCLQFPVGARLTPRQPFLGARRRSIATSRAATR